MFVTTRYTKQSIVLPKKIPMAIVTRIVKVATTEIKDAAEENPYNLDFTKVLGAAPTATPSVSLVKFSDTEVILSVSATTA